MKHLDPPLQHHFDLGGLGQAETVVAVAAVAGQLPELARWAGVDAVSRFEATVTLRRLSQTRFSYEAELTADVVQACVVTLEPVPARISRTIARELQQAPRLPKEAGELTLSAGDDDVPETILGRDYDLAAPLLEEFVLAIDPYPRKAGVAFAPSDEGKETQQNPFAVLKTLKDRG